MIYDIFPLNVKNKFHGNVLIKKCKNVFFIIIIWDFKIRIKK